MNNSNNGSAYASNTYPGSYSINNFHAPSPALAPGSDGNCLQNIDGKCVRGGTIFCGGGTSGYNMPSMGGANAVGGSSRSGADAAGLAQNQNCKCVAFPAFLQGINPYGGKYYVTTSVDGLYK